VGVFWEGGGGEETTGNKLPPAPY